MKIKLFFKNLVPFLPLLAVYIAIGVVFASDEIIHDEKRYLTYATNLTHGFFTDTDNPELRNGPGYPLIISPLVLLQMPNNIFKLLNAIFLLTAVVFFYKSIAIYLHPREAIALSYLLGLYPAFLKWMIYIHSESFTIFLICGFIYYFMRVNSSFSKRHINVILAGAFLGILALTKVIFGYVILCGAFFYLMSYFFNKSRKAKSSLIILAIGFMFCIPYLYYTYSITGKKFYWGTQSGEILYWRSTPFENEYGDWISADVVLGSKDQSYFDTAKISENHKIFFQSLEPYSNIQKDSILKAKAIDNIEQHPVKYIYNTGASVFRLFFNFPFSYTPQKPSTFFYMLPNVFLIVFLVLSSYLAIRKAAAIPFEIRFIAFISLVYMGGIVLLNGRVRHLLPIVPLLVYFIIYVFRRLIVIEINQKQNNGKQDSFDTIPPKNV